MYGHIQGVERTHWWYVGRRRIVFDWVLQILSAYPSPRVLDVGCGTGFNIERLRSYGYEQVVGLDFSAEALNFCRMRDLRYLVCGDGTSSPFRHESFDMIVALDLIEHLRDDVQGLKEFSRLLRPDGSLIIFVPAFDFLWGLQDEVSHHHRRYVASDLRRKFEIAGLRIVKLSYANFFLFPLIWAGRTFLRLSGYQVRGVSENDLHPAWSNGLLRAIFSAERFLIRRANLPFGVSLLCVATKPKFGE